MQTRSTDGLPRTCRACETDAARTRAVSGEVGASSRSDRDWAEAEIHQLHVRSRERNREIETGELEPEMRVLARMGAESTSHPSTASNANCWFPSRASELL